MNFDRLTSYLDSLRETEGIPGSACLVLRDHKTVYSHTEGFSDAAGTMPVTLEDQYLLYSATKPLTAVAAMQLVEAGKLKLSDPIGDLLPEFRSMRVGDAPARNAITVEHLLTMCGGFDYNLGIEPIQEVCRNNPNATTAEIIAALAKAPLHFEPGTRFCYSLCLDVMARVIEVVSGRTFGQYMKEHLFDPLGMADSGFSIEKATRLTQQYEYRSEAGGPVAVPNTNGLVPTPHYESGGAGLVSTITDYGKFVEAMCNGGVGRSGARILSAQSVAAFRVNRLGPVQLADFAGCNKPGYGYGLGMRVLLEKEKSGAKSPLGEFGWDGAAGAYLMIDTEHRLGIVYTQQVLGRDVANIIHTHIRNLVYEILGL